MTVAVDTVVPLGRSLPIHADVVVVGTRALAEPLVAAAYRAYLPERTIAWVDPSDKESKSTPGAWREVRQSSLS